MTLTTLKVDKEITLHSEINTDILKINTKTFKLKNKSWRTKAWIRLLPIESKLIDLLESSNKLDRRMSLLKSNKFNCLRLFLTQSKRLVQEPMSFLKLESIATHVTLKIFLAEKKSSSKKDSSTNKKKPATTNTTHSSVSEKLKFVSTMNSALSTNESTS